MRSQGISPNDEGTSHSYDVSLKGPRTVDGSSARSSSAWVYTTKQRSWWSQRSESSERRAFRPTMADDDIEHSRE